MLLFRPSISVRCWGRVDSGGAAREWMGLVFQRGRDWETKDPSEGWAAGTLKRDCGGGGRAVAGCVSRGGGGQRCRETVWRAEGGGGRQGGRGGELLKREDGLGSLGWALAGLQSGGLRGPWTGGSRRGGDGGSDGYLLDSVLASREVDGERVKPLVMMMTNCTEWRVEEGKKKGVEKDCKGELMLMNKN